MSEEAVSVPMFVMIFTSGLITGGCLVQIAYCLLTMPPRVPSNSYTEDSYSGGKDAK